MRIADGSKKRAILSVLKNPNNKITKDTPITEIVKMVKKQEGQDVSTNYVVTTRTEHFASLNERPVAGAASVPETPSISGMVSVANVQKVKELVASYNATNIRAVADLITEIGSENVKKLVDLFADE
jgi:hypothetical protein